MCTTNKVCRIIAIANQKGGVGKTTTTSNLGIGLVKLDLTEGILTHKEGVDLMPENIELSGLEVSLVNVMSREVVSSFRFLPLRRPLSIPTLRRLRRCGHISENFSLTCLYLSEL